MVSSFIWILYDKLNGENPVETEVRGKGEYSYVFIENEFEIFVFAVLDSIDICNFNFSIIHVTLYNTFLIETKIFLPFLLFNDKTY